MPRTPNENGENSLPIPNGEVASPEETPSADNSTAPGASREVDATNCSQEPSSTRFPRTGESIEIRDGQNWRKVNVLGRGGKATSRTTRDYFNVREDDND